MIAFGMSLTIVMSIVGLDPVEGMIHERVDLVELNHCYDESAKHVFDQVIFYEWSPSRQVYQVLAWRLVKHPSQVPQSDARRDDFVVTWQDGPVLRRVRATTFRETWTQDDPELAARATLPKEERRGLLVPGLNTWKGG